MRINLNASLSFLLLFSGGAIFFFYPNWLIIPIFSVAWFLFECFCTGKKPPLPAIMVGFFLLAFDFIIENVGAVMGFWVSMNSSFQVLAVPVEVMITCFFGGASFSILLSSMNLDLKLVLASILLWSLGGTMGELFLRSVKLMKYSNGWLSFPHAFISYCLTFLLLHLIQRFFVGTREIV